MILIIGGGIGGLTAALALGHAGFDVEIYERSEELREVGAGVSIWKNALGALETIGVDSAIRAFSVPQADAGLRTETGRLLIGATEAMRRTFGEVGLVLHRAVLQRVLADTLGRDRIRLGKTCTGIDLDAAGVSARFADGTFARGSALIGADGLHSFVRTWLHGAAPPVYAGYTSWRSVVPFDHRALAPGESWGRGTRFGQIPMAGGQVYWFGVQNAPAGQRSTDGEKAELARIFRTWHAPIPALIDAASEASIIRVDIFDRPPLRAWGRGPVTLLGDAAHPMTPNLGQGACQAIEDAVVLARSLRDTPDVPEALRTYEARRIPRTSKLVRASRQVGAIGHWENPVGVWCRNAFMKHVGSRMQTRQLADVIDYVP